MSECVTLKWSQNDIVLFLEEYQKHPSLWDPSDMNYRNRDARISAEKDILRDMNLEHMDTKVFRSKVKSIRATYSQEVQKFSKNEGEYPFVSRLSWFPLADKFLAKILDNRKTQSSSVANQSSFDFIDCEASGNILEIDEELIAGAAAAQELCAPSNSKIGSENEYVEYKDLNTLENYKQSPMSGHSSSTSKHRNTTPRNTYTQRGSKKKKIAPHDSSSMFETQDREDEFDQYGKYIATQMRHMPLQTALETQIEVNNLIAKRRLELIRADDYQRSNDALSAITPLTSCCESTISDSSNSSFSTPYEFVQIKKEEDQQDQ